MQAALSLGIPADLAARIKGMRFIRCRAMPAASVANQKWELQHHGS
jgi:hypothetical protein